MASNGALYSAALVGFLLFTTHIQCQQTTTTNTNCNVYGNTANCNSTTTDNGAQQAERNRESYETGQKVGAALGTGIAAAMQSHSFNKDLRRYCDAHPGEEWAYYSREDGHKLSSGKCPSDEDKEIAAANEFVSRHKDYMRVPVNARTMASYVEDHRLDPRDEKSYERAYKDLKKSGQLEVYAK